ncbi:MAG: alkaline phosphatase [Rubrobacteraceae bacterium]
MPQSLRQGDHNIHNVEKKSCKRLFLAPLILTVLILGNACSGEESSGNARSTILFIGDGLGAAHRGAIRLAEVGSEDNLEMDSLPHTGFSSTSPVGSGTPVTDSAAGGTAIASGVKTRNGTVGVDAEGERVPTLLEQAKEVGKSAGLVTTSQVTDATPAAFGAHVESRYNQSEIARQYLEATKPDVILGGGEDYWYPEGDPGAHPDSSSEDSEEGSRGYKGDLVAKAEKLGYDYVTGAEGLDSADGPKLLGLFANAQMFVSGPEGEGAVYDPAVSLPVMTRKAIEVLSENEEGFFLLVEEEAIDEMSHANNAKLTLKAGQQLDESVKVAKDYVESNPDTLLIVAADHETGGMSVEALDQGSEKQQLDPGEDGPFPVADSEIQFSIDWTTGDHTAGNVPITAEGPGADRVEGVYENTHLYEAIKESLLGG